MQYAQLQAMSETQNMSKTGLVYKYQDRSKIKFEFN